MSGIRVVSHAINGRGLGHLVRQLAILRWIRRITASLDIPCECWLITSSEADTLARREGFPALKIPSKAMMHDAGIGPERWLAVARGWILSAMSGLQPDLLLVDTFPGGSYGELLPVLELARRRVLVARAVKGDFAATDAYRSLLPLYDDVIVPDEAGVGSILLRERCELMGRASARRALGVPEGQRAVYLTLGGGGEISAADTLPRLVPRLLERGWHVVVGAGPLYQGPELRGPGVTWVDRYVPMELLAGVDAAVAAAGYNTFNELMYVGVPTVFLPLPRIADDQAARARYASAAGAGRVAERLDDVPDLLDNPGDPDAARALVPINGAREAALRALRTLVPDKDLALAAEVWSPEVIGLLRDAGEGRPGGGDTVKRAMDLVRLLAGGRPSELARRRAILRDMGVEPPVSPNADTRGVAARIEAFAALCATHGLPIDLAAQILRTLSRIFPAAGPTELVDAAGILFPCWARFDDWMGALSLLRAIPVQRGFAIQDFASALTCWLAREEDLFDALRAFTRREAGGREAVASILRELGG